MSVNLATGQNTTKRVRIHSTMNHNITTDKGKATKLKTPKALALACVQGTAASLHPQVKPIVETYGNRLIDTYHKIQQKNTQLSKMENNLDFIPRSARINFEFYVRPEVQRTDEFNAIQSNTTALIKTFQLNLKEQIISTMKLDIKHLQTELETTICHLMYYTSKAFHLQHNPTIIDHTATHTVAFLINGFGENLLKHYNLNKNSFKVKFSEIFHDNTIMNLLSFVAPQPANVSNANNPLNRYARNLSQPTATQDNPSPSSININPATKFVDFLRQTLEGILVVAIDNYKTQVNTNKATSQLEAFHTELLHEQATSDTANQMNFSPSVSPQELEELIAKSTSKAVASLTREVQSLKSKLENSNAKSNRQKPTSRTSNETSKNSPRRGRSSASLKKKKSNQTTSRSPSPSTNAKRSRSRSKKPHNKRPDDKNRDSSREKSKWQNKPNKTRSNKRHTSSDRNSKRN